MTDISREEAKANYIRYNNEYLGIDAEDNYYTYEVNGNVLTCRQLESSLSGFSMDGPGPNYPSNDIIQNYHFGFNGTNLVLERGGATIELMPARVVEMENASRDSSEETAVYSIEGGTNAENPYHDITGFYFGYELSAMRTSAIHDDHN